MKKQMLILFQNEIDYRKEPEWVIGINQGKEFAWDNDNDEPCVFNAILTESQFNKLECWASLCSYEIVRMGKKNPYNTYNVKPKMFDSFISMLAKMKEAAE